jgi:VWFA-related protein
MRNERILYSVLVVWCNCLVLGVCLNISSPAQSSATGNERTRMRDFGMSLRKFDKKSKDKIQNQGANVAGEANRSGGYSDAGNVGGAAAVVVTRTGDEEVVRVETSLFVNDVLVLGKDGRPVTGLSRDDFVVRENDRLQEIEIFASGDSKIIPRSIVLLIDYSGSQLPYIKTSVEAAKILIDKLNPNDRMAIVTDDVELAQDFTTDKILLKEKLEWLKTSALSGRPGRSRQYTALMATLKELFADDEALRPIIIFQTDGDELGLLKSRMSGTLLQNNQEIKFSYEEVLSAAKKTGAILYTIIPGPRFIGLPDEETLNRARLYLENGEKALAAIRRLDFQPGQRKISGKYLKAQAELYVRQQSAIAEIAKITGGWTDFLEQPEQAERVYSEILAGMNRRYIIGYYPTDQTRDGKIRRVSTEVRGRSDYIIRGRRTYVPRPAAQ